MTSNGFDFRVGLVKNTDLAAIGYQRNMELVSNAYLYRYFLNIPSRSGEYMIIYGYPL